MQNKKSSKFRSFVKEKGYYIVLLICAAAVGVSSYFIFTEDREKEPEETAGIRETETTVQKPTREIAETVMATEEVAATELREAFFVSWPLKGETVTAFAADHLAITPTTKDWRTHEGVDLRAVVGQEVRAAAPGTVYTVYEDKNLGMTVVLRHEDGFTTHYSNLGEEVQVKAGQKVDRGTVLGTVGQTANAETATEPHVHFALYQNNVPVDPGDFAR